MEQQPPKDLTDYDDDSYRELTHAEAQALHNLFKREMNGMGFDPKKEIDQQLLYRSFFERMRLVQEEKFTTAHLRVYIALVLSTKSSEVVQWAWTIRNIYESMYKAHVLEGEKDRVIVGLEDWSHYFAEGAPREETLVENWREQKIANGANRLDSEHLWPIDGNIIKET